MPGLRWPLRHGWQIARLPSPEALTDSSGDDAGVAWAALAELQMAGAWLAEQGQGWPVEATRDLDDETWAWRLRFDRPEGLGQDAVLALDGLATCCSVALNGERLLDSTSMFLSHRLPVGDRLRASDNELRIVAQPLAPRLAERRPRPAWRVPMLRQQQLRWWRTTLLGRTPGWSPPVPPVGPWRPIWLASAAALLPERLQLRPTLDGETGWLDAALSDAPDETLTLELRRGGRRHRVVLERAGDGVARGRLRIDAVARWWPHTHGEPALYDACLWIGQGEAARALPLRPVGFRSVRWQGDDGQVGLVINGVPVFARGACWTPLDAHRLQGPDDAYAPAIDAVRQAGMNLLRVSGTMVYESDAFHRACDRAGVMVWQEFMFANMDYPADDPAFLAAVQAEVRQQAMRWQGSPSLVVLCGNSEVEQQAAMLGVSRERWSPALFHAQLPAWCADLLPGTPYWPSSAHGGAWPFAPASGTCSYYGVGAYQRPLVDARDSAVRFATECLAFAQVPEHPALARMPGGGHALRVHHAAWKQGAPRDLGAGWDFEDVRDHYLQREFGLDPTALRRHDHERYLTLSRLVVARVVESAFSQWRAADSRCRGALVWFLRDLQPGAGWGFLDDQGDPKSAWHALRRVLQPVTLLLTDEGLNGVAMHLVNETPQALDASWTIALFQGTRCLERVTQPCRLEPRHTQRIDVAACLPHFIDLAWAYRFGPPAYDLLQAVLQGPDGRVWARAHHLCGGWPAALDDAPSLAARARRVDADTLALDLHAGRLALGVHLEIAGYRPADDWFDLAPDERRTVHLQACGAATQVWRGSVQAANHRWPVTVAPPNGEGA